MRLRSQLCIIGLLALYAPSFAQAQDPPLIEDPLEKDPRLVTKVTIKSPSIPLPDALRRLAQQADVKLKAEGVAAVNATISCSWRALPLKDALDSLTLFNPRLMWERRDDTLVLRARRDPRRWQSLNAVLTPQTEAQKALRQHSQVFLAEMNNLSRSAQQALQAPGEDGGVPVRQLPARMQEALHGITAASRQEHVEKGHEGPGALPDFSDGAVSLQVTPTEDFNTYNLRLRAPQGGVFATTFTDYEPGPRPPDETLPPAEEARAKAERRDLLAKDSRLERAVTLRGQGVTLTAALAMLADRAEVSFISEGAEARPDPLNFEFRSMPVRQIIEELQKLYRFEWERSKGGVLTVRGGRFGAQMTAREDAMRGLMDEYGKLSSGLLDALASEEGVSFGDLPDGFRRALESSFGQVKLSTGDSLDLSSASIRFFPQDRDGQRMYTLGVNIRDPGGKVIGIRMMFNPPPVR